MPWGESDDDALAEGIRGGLPAAEEAFDARFRPKLLAFARLRGISPGDADDVVQDALIAALRQIREGRFEGRSSLAHWVRTIFHNRAVDAHRVAVRWRGRFGEIENLVGSEPDALALARDPAVLDQTRVRVREALLGLSKRERLVLLLNALDGLPAREIAPLIRLGQKSTEAILTAARKRFRELLRDSECRKPRASERLEE